MIKKTMFVATLAAAVLCMAVPALAEPQEYTTSDGVLSIELPDENWKEMADPATWAAFSDGANLITLEHLSNGEDLPDMAIADDHYVNVYQAIASTQNEVFIITGFVVDSAKITDVCKAIMSVKVLKYDTKLAVKKQQQETSAGYTIVPMDATMYTTAGVNVRAGYSTNDKILGGLGAGSSVHVTGKVQKDGADLGWNQVSYNGGPGYISASFLTNKAPANSSGSNSAQFTGEARTIYEIDGAAVTVYKRTDGQWVDSEGHVYTQITDYEFQADNGVVLTTNKPQAYTGNEPLSSGFTAYWPNSNATTLTPYSDGYYYSSEWIRYTDNQDGSYSGADGSTLYDYDPISGSPDDAYESDY